MANPVEDGVGEGGLVDDVVPGLGRQSAGDDGGAGAVAVLADFHEIPPLPGRQAVGAPVVEE